MDLIEMYPAAVNSKVTVTLGVLNADSTIIEVLDGSVLPDAPTLLVLGSDQTAETVKLTAKEGNTLTVERGIQGNAIAWPAGTQIARNFTAKDWDDLVANVATIVAKIMGLSATDVHARPDTWMPNASDVGAPFIINASNMTLTELANCTEVWNYPFIFIIGWDSEISPKNSSTFGIGIRHMLWAFDNGGNVYNCENPDIGWIDVTGKFLPLDGSVAMSGGLVIDVTQPRVHLRDKNVTLNKLPSANTYSCIEYRDTTGARFADITQAMDANGNGFFSFGAQNIYGVSDGVFKVGTRADGTGLLTYKEKAVFHEGNKPSGSYTGNGSAERRIIETGGVGRCAVIYNSSANEMCFATPAGAFYRTGNGIEYTDMIAFYINGNLSIATYSIINTSQQTYYYEVL